MEPKRVNCEHAYNGKDCDKDVPLRYCATDCPFYRYKNIYVDI